MPTRRAPRRRTAAINTANLNPALTELLRRIAASNASESEDTGSADRVSRAPGTREACLSPAQMLALHSTRRTHPAGIDDRGLWCAEAKVTVRKDGVAFNAMQWFHPLLLTMVAGGKAVARAGFVVLYDASARASGTLRECHLYQRFGTGDRRFIATLHEKEEAAAVLDIEQFMKARDQEIDDVHAQRAAAQDGYAGLLIGPEAVKEHQQREAERAASAARRKPKPRVANPISASAQARARRQAEADEVYTLDPQPVAPTPRRGQRADPLDGVRAADVPPHATSSNSDASGAASTAHEQPSTDDDVMPPPRSARSRR